METKPLNRRPRLAHAVVTDLRRQIETGLLQPGIQLPTEPQLEAHFNVSRTVVREAIAELRAAGFVVPIQGKGMFVSEAMPSTVTALSAGEIKSIPQTLEMLEFRTALEGEAAAIAAYRRSASQEDSIRAANEEMRRLAEAGEATVDVDFDFHMAIARATNNSFFVEALARFGARSIPRSQFPTLVDATTKKYLLGVIDEHSRIVDAIADQQPEAARLAMREHLLGSQRRYRQLAR